MALDFSEISLLTITPLENPIWGCSRMVNEMELDSSRVKALSRFIEESSRKESEKAKEYSCIQTAPGTMENGRMGCDMVRDFSSTLMDEKSTLIGSKVKWWRDDITLPEAT